MILHLESWKWREVTITTQSALSSALVFPPFLSHSDRRADNAHLQSASNHMRRSSDQLTPSDLLRYVWWLAKRSLMALELSNQRYLLDLLAYTVKKLHENSLCWDQVFKLKCCLLECVI